MEHSISCPVCPFASAVLIDAGDFHAYVCPQCGWTQETLDRRRGNRPADVCALCDHAIEIGNATGSDADYHLFLGAILSFMADAAMAWNIRAVEEIAVHRTCLSLKHDDIDNPERYPFAHVTAAHVLYRLGYRGPEVDAETLHTQALDRLLKRARAS